MLVLKLFRLSLLLFTNQRAKGDKVYASPAKNEYTKKHYKSNLEYYAEKRKLNNLRYKQRNRDYVAQYLTEHPCIDCGEQDIRLLQFDHVRGVKLKSVSEMVSRLVSLSTLQAEIDKCDVRCAHCHIKKTGKDFGWWWSKL